MMHTWYLNVDTQLFLLAPFIVYSIYRFIAKALFALAILVLGCVATTVAIHLHYGLKTLRTNGKMELAYFPTHIRFSPWLIGVIAGYVFVKARQQPIQIPKVNNFHQIENFDIRIPKDSTLNKVYFLFSDVQSLCLDHFIGHDGYCDLFDTSA